MKTFDVVVLTEDKYVNPKDDNLYIRNILQEDGLALDALKQEGLSVTRKSWSDPNFDWSSTQYILFRTTWDYQERFEEFSSWLKSVSEVCTLLNSAELIHWNIDKHYLSDLKANGIPVCETHFIETGTETSLKDLQNQLKWDNMVLKPCVSAGGRHTYKLNSENISDYEGLFQELIANESMMLQPFQHNITSMGEYSFMIMDGQYTHAVLKKAKSGDFRVQDDFGGTVHDYTATQEQIELAEQAVKACIEAPIYARVDVILNNYNQHVISEIELIEPELWFRNHHEAANVLAKGIAKLIRK